MIIRNGIKYVIIKKENSYLEQNAALFGWRETHRKSKLWYIGQIGNIPKYI